MESQMKKPATTLSVLTQTLDPKGDVKGQNIFYENIHVAYQIKGNGAQSTMQAHILSLQTPLTCRLD